MAIFGYPSYVGPNSLSLLKRRPHVTDSFGSRRAILLAAILCWPNAVCRAADIKMCTEAAEAGKPNLAISQCQEAIRSGQLSPEELILAHFTIALGYMEKREYNSAIEQTSRALQVHPDSPLQADLYAARGSVHEAKGDHDSAIGDFNSAIQLRPDFAIAYLQRGSAYHLKGEHKKAGLDFQEAYKLNPTDRQSQPQCMSTPATMKRHPSQPRWEGL